LIEVKAHHWKDKYIEPMGQASFSHAGTVKVWDLFIRVFHWAVAVAFFVAYFTEDEILTLHVWAGYTIGALLLLRIVWGFVGPVHARFGDFLFGPVKTLGYLADLVTFRAKRYLGHSPAGATMVFALLLGLAATVGTGLELYALEEGAGPLALLSETRLQKDLSASQDVSDDEEDGAGERARNRNGGEEFWEEAHEVLANFMLVLVLLHIAGVVLASFVHRENLTRAMLTGYKRPEPPD
jgi:cytochrome b